MRFAVLLFVVSLTAGCAGVGVVSTSDPLVKLNQAEDLFLTQGRPLIAERLIQEARATYQERGDSQGLGHADREYADLLISPTVSGKWAKYYRENGFLDKTVTYDNRTAKASEYYGKAVEHYARAVDQLRSADNYGSLTNVYFNMGYSYYRLDDLAKACRFYDEALGAYNENMRRNPDAKLQGSITNAVADRKKWAKCT
jgi:tetratricopeptide (TPR) repeat protein